MPKSGNHSLTAAIVDDDFKSAALLKKIIEDYVPEVEVTDVFTEPHEAVIAFNKKMPDLLFLDIEMPGINGIELVQMLPAGSEKAVIYVTGHDKFAIEAIKLGVQDYLMKPITAAQVKEAVNAFIRKKELVNNRLSSSLRNKIIINKHDMLYVVDVDDILYMEAEGPYTLIFLADGKEIKSSKALGYYKKLLGDFDNLISIHRSYLLNFSHIQGIEKDENNEGTLILSNNHRITFSASIKNKLVQLIEEIIVANMKE